MKGQAFSTFKILIGAVFATMLLAIVYFVSVSKPPIPSTEMVLDLVKQATNAPDICFSREDVNFVKGESFLTNAAVFSSYSLTCFSSTYAPISCPTCDRCTVNRDIKTAVSAKCVPSSPVSCDVHVYFGSPECK